jgi:hypothetical protein
MVVTTSPTCKENYEKQRSNTSTSQPYLQAVEDGGLACTVQAQDQDAHLLLTPQLGEH